MEPPSPRSGTPIRGRRNRAATLRSPPWPSARYHPIRAARPRCYFSLPTQGMPTPNRPVAVLFDLDGTLIDSIALLLGSVRHAFDGFKGRSPTEEEWIAGIGTPLAKQLRAFA